jgi:serine beta-lactamase-like protein LACTB
MPKGRTQKLIIAAALVIGFIPIAVLGLFMYASATAPILHPNVQAVPSAPGERPGEQWTDAAERGRQIVRAALAEQNVPGISVAVGAGSKIVWAEGFGYADIDKKSPMTPKTVLRIGTASKVLTSAGVGLLLEQGKLNLDEVIQKRVPEFPEKQWPVTLRQLMAHTAGVRSDSGDEGPLFGMQCDRPVDAFKEFADSALLFEPGTEYRYSHYGWIVVSAAVEAAAEEPFLNFMRKKVFEPLGMDNTVPDSTTALPELATFYFPGLAGDPRYGPDVMREVNYTCYSGSSVFLSTPTDMVRFAMAIKSGTLLKPSTVELLRTPQRLPSGAETGYALGWDIETAKLNGRDTRVVGHDGDQLAGQVSSLITFPDSDLVVSVISNMSYSDTYSVALKIAEVFVAQEKP